jgi:hypothetical protein
MKDERLETNMGREGIVTPSFSITALMAAFERREREKSQNTIKNKEK